MAYPTPYKAAPWRVQVEFLDGTIINGQSDEDILERWRRVASWTDPDAAKDPDMWLSKILHRAEVFYGVPIGAMNARTPIYDILELFAAEGVITLRRQ